ncbi:MAG: flagellar hook-basal body complex protein FliE [Candidatus Gastranaerophilales bacterium]|nr:flagellar hook-basal body complex protein FliE [Candidatus Gastranaerophilales bacterium]
MSESFNINTNFNMGSFDNSINEFNKVFSNSLNQTNQNIASAQSFDEIFNSFNANQIAPIQASATMQVGMDSISASKIENLSPTAKMASDIGAGFKNGLSQVSTLGKEAEEAFETFASGGDISVHDVMIASQKSGLAMQMAIQLRNQMVNAYNEFKGMSI